MIDRLMYWFGMLVIFVHRRANGIYVVKTN